MSAQTFTSIFRAEVSRLTGRGGARTWFIVAVAFAVAMAVLAIVLSNVQEIQEVSNFSLADLLSAGPMFTLVVMALAVTSHKAREIGDGTVLTSKVLVPRYRLLFTARLVAWGVVTLVLGVVVSFLSLMLAVLPSGMANSTLGETLGATATSLFLAVLFVLFFGASAALLQRGAVIVFVGMLLLLILPAGFLIAGGFIAGPLGTAVSALAKVLPGTLLFTGMQPPNQAIDTTWSEWSGAVFGVSAWVIAFSLLAYSQFRKPGYGDR